MQNIPSPAAAEQPAEALGPGATALSSVFGVLVGLVVGMITTFTHGQLAPWGLIAGLAIVTALVAGFRLVFGSRVVGGAAALGVIASSALLALPGAGGAALSLHGVPDYLWAFGPAVLSLIVLLVPVRRRQGSA
jgi:N-acetyl-1-D-myo-inositol-2-amino-2-deoxy-alpha-D-glucopyranoside deacetylase